MNLQELTNDELAALLKKIEIEQERRRHKAKQEILNNARSSGIDIEKEASESLVYRNPDDPWQVWRPGRGRRPKWLNEWLASGRTLEELEDREKKL